MSSELDSWSCQLLAMYQTMSHCEVLAYLAVHSGIETVSPAVAVVPVKVSPHGKQLVFGAGVGHVASEDVDVVLVLLQPVRVEIANHGASKDVIAVVEVVIIVVRVPEVGARVSGNIACRRYNTTPSSCRPAS